MQFTLTQRQVLAWAALLCVLATVLWLLGPVLMPFVVAAVLAYVLNPMVDRLQQAAGRRCPRALAVVLVEVLFVLAVIAS